MARSDDVDKSGRLAYSGIRHIRDEAHDRRLRTPSSSANASTLFGLGIVASLAALDLVLRSNLSGTLALSAVVAAMVGSARRTAFVAVTAIAAAGALAVHDNAAMSEGTARVLVVAATSIVATIGAARRERREQRLANVEHVASVAQRALLLPLPARVGSFQLASAYRSATQEAQLGGDFYTLVDSPYGPRLILGDVRGKGIERVHLAAAVLRCFRDAAVTCGDLLDVVHAIDRCLAGEMHLEDFVTAVLVQFGADAELRVVNCGHHPPGRLGPFGWDLLDTPPTTPFGLHPQPTETTIRLDAKERLLLYTDGLAEARRPGGEFIELDEYVRSVTGADPSEALDGIVNSIRAAAGGTLDDDVAAVLIQPA